MKTKRTLLLFSSLALATAVALPARADDTADLQQQLDEPVVTTATQSAETATTAPATSTTITAEDLRRFGIESLDQALDFLALGVFTSDPLHQVDIGARGVTVTQDQGNHFLLLVDGHMMNEPLFGSARFGRGAGIPIEIIDHIEVILGPGSVLYGSNAMLGVINVVTKRQKDFHGGHVIGEWQPGKSVRGAIGAGYEFPLFGRRWELTTQIEGYSQSGPAFTLGPQYTGIDPVDGKPERFSRDPNAHTGVWGGVADQSYWSKIPAGLLRLSSGPFELEVLASSYKRAWPYFDIRTRDNGNFNDPDAWELDRSLRFDLKWRRVLSPIVSMSARLYADSFEYERQGIDSRAGGCLYPGQVTCVNVTRGYSRWGGLELQSSFDWLTDGTLVSLLGVDARHLWVAHQHDVFSDPARLPLDSSTEVIHESEDVLGAYMQHEWRPKKWIALNGGVRLDEAERYRPVFSPRLALVLMPWRGGALKGVYAEAFRAPSWYDRAASSPTLLPSDNLLPERVKSIQGSIEQKFATHRIFFDVFASRWTDMIEAYVLSADEVRAAAARGEIDNLRAIVFRQYRNVAQIDDVGFDFGLDGSFLDGVLRYGINVTRANARRSDPRAPDGHDLTVAPRIFGNARIAFAPGAPGGWLPTFALAAQYLGKRPADRAWDGNFIPTPYADPLLVLRGTVGGAVPVVPGLSYRLSAQWSSASYGPYVIGPGQSHDDRFNEVRHANIVSAELVPIDRFRATIGLRYDFDTSFAGVAGSTP